MNFNNFSYKIYVEDFFLVFYLFFIFFSMIKDVVVLDSSNIKYKCGRIIRSKNLQHKKIKKTEKKIKKNLFDIILSVI